MSGERRPTADGAIARTAGKQHGVVTAAQLRALGVNQNALEHRLRVGRLHRLHRGVYAVGHRRVSREGHVLAGVLSVGADAVVSHRSAAVVWGLIADRGGPVDVTVSRRLHPRPPVHIHIDRHGLEKRDRTRTAGIPVTTVPRTLLDLAAVVSEPILRRAVRQAYVERLVDEGTLSAQLDRGAARHGASRLAQLLGPKLLPTRSELEDRVLDLLKTRGFARPAVNVVPAGLRRRIEVDFLYADAGLVIEADGARYHDSRVARDEDAARQALLEEAGYQVLRVDWTQVTQRPGQTARRLRQALGTRGRAD